ncbi:hypothetical protein DACRYDRAFT_18804 [Dacryopinax primogenitus]|uniref:Uncharacterized protein n=1 Tax=Dacryopinax primogenitus (strain DJM 731) TaxID=1858805 RepID=M5FPZ9_DACPD|nr:uncharacterized protein DACRYDRAFT_18804 [Dacryopinax primogenitus]EJT97443.1 hypothetical protein DACRYDRAFT_18804 [Dacryopinax primogenitus]
MWLVWAPQTLYDVHFLANDWLHRLFKGAELATFAFIGACAAQFDPWNVTWSAEVSQEAAILNAKASSFRGVAISYAVGRALLALQYGFVCIRVLVQSIDSAVPESKGHLSLALVPGLVHGVSGGLWITAAFLSQSQAAKLALAYSGIFLEFVFVVFQPLFEHGYIDPPAEIISERFGALTLIILGEGIIGLIRNFSFVISGFGFTTTASWHFMFHGFSAHTFGAQRSSGALWLILHLPLHFSLLLLFAGIRTATVYGNMVGAIQEVQNTLSPIVSAMQGGDLELHTVQSQNVWMTMQLGKLDMPTRWEDQVGIWQKAIGNRSEPAVDLTISSYGYIAEIWLAIADSFEVELSDTLINQTEVIANLNDTWISNPVTRVALEQADDSMYLSFANDFSVEIAQGVLFFFPAAVLLRTQPQGVWMWVLWFLQLSAGIVLCLLGFLGQGNQFQNPANEAALLVYKLLDVSWLMPIVSIVYGSLIILEYCLIWHPTGDTVASSPRQMEVTPPRTDGTTREVLLDAAASAEEGRGTLLHIPQFHIDGVVVDKQTPAKERSA